MVWLSGQIFYTVSYTPISTSAGFQTYSFMELFWATALDILYMAAKALCKVSGLKRLKDNGAGTLKPHYRSTWMFSVSIDQALRP